MKTKTIIFSLLLCFCHLLNAQDNPNKGNELMKQGQNCLEQKEYIKARYLFKQAYGIFSSQGEYEKAITCGIKANTLFLRENLYKEAFDFCREMDQSIYTGEQKINKTLYDLRFLITKERFQMYIALKNPAQSKTQLDRLEEIVKTSKNNTLKEDLLYTKANYYYTFGQNTLGDECFQHLIADYKKQKKYEKVSDCYKNLIAIARKANNASLIDRTFQKYMVWADSAKMLTAKDKFNVLKQKYDHSLQVIKDKDSSISAKQYVITGLGIIIAALIGALIFVLFILLRFADRNKKLKSNIRIANEHNEQKTEFIRNISVQMEPALTTLYSLSKEISQASSSLSERMGKYINALKKFSDDIQELSAFENSLEELFEVSPVNANSFCQAVMEGIKDKVAPEVSTMVSAVNMQVKINPGQVERILNYLLENAALHTTNGKIILEFKKRSARTYQFIVTDNGPGIPVEKQGDLFKPFAEVKDLAQGDGLGLPICSLIAIKMNGTLSLDPTYTKGCRFVLELHV